MWPSVSQIHSAQTLSHNLRRNANLCKANRNTFMYTRNQQRHYSWSRMSRLQPFLRKSPALIGTNLQPGKKSLTLYIAIKAASGITTITAGYLYIIHPSTGAEEAKSEDINSAVELGSSMDRFVFSIYAKR